MNGDVKIIRRQTNIQLTYLSIKKYIKEDSRISEEIPIDSNISKRILFR